MDSDAALFERWVSACVSALDHRPEMILKVLILKVKQDSASIAMEIQSKTASVQSPLTKPSGAWTILSSQASW